MLARRATAHRFPPKTLSLSEQIGKYERQPNGAIVFQLMEDIEEDRLASYGFRHSSLRTQAKQDSVLRDYRKFIRLSHDQSPDLDDDATDLLGFPEDIQALTVNLKNYLIFVYTHSTGRAIAHGPGQAPGQKLGKVRMLYKSLIPYREALLFWIPRTFRDRNIESPRRAPMFNNLTETMRYLQKKYVPGRPQWQRASLGLVELRQLLESELTGNKCKELSEQHQVIWCIARQTAVRPSSIGWDKFRKNQYLRWEDIAFESKGNGTFTAIITFKHLKTNYEDPEKGEWRILECYLDSPNAENIMFSVPHRLLMIALRRKLIKGIETIDDLITTRLANITIKEEFRRDPVFLRGTPGGRSLDTKRNVEGNLNALASGSLTSYLADCGRALGYVQRITMYAFRRRTASELVVRVGYEMTREIMGHEPQSQTLERYYLNLRPVLDLTGITLAQPIDHMGVKAKALSEYAPIANSALTPETMKRIRGVALNNLVDQLIDEDDNYPIDGNEVTLKSYLQRVRAYALRVLMDEAGREQKETITRDDLYKRRKEFVASAAAFAKRVREQAQQMMSSMSDIDIAKLERDSGENLDADFEEGTEESLLLAYEQDAEIDAEINTGVKRTLRVTGEEFNREADTSTTVPESNVPYFAVAQGFLEILEQNLMREGDKRMWKDVEVKTCPLCQEDSTIAEDVKNKPWRDQQSLEKHMHTGEAHTPYGRWKRLVQANAKNAKEKDPDMKKHFQCPYGGEDDVFIDFRSLVRHIRNTIESGGKKNPQHYEAILADGWEDKETWEGVPSAQMQRQRAVVNLEEFAKAGAPFVRRIYQVLTPHPARGGIFTGDVKTALISQIPPKFKGVVVPAIHLGKDKYEACFKRLRYLFERSGRSSLAMHQDIPTDFTAYVSRGKRKATDEETKGRSRSIKRQRV